MKNTLKKILETQQLYCVTSNNKFGYTFKNKNNDYDIYVSVERIDDTSLIIEADTLRSIFEPSTPQLSDGSYTYYSLQIENLHYYISVTKEEDIYFQSLLQRAYKNYQIDLFNDINKQIDELTKSNTPNAEQKFEQVKQNIVNNDKE